MSALFRMTLMALLVLSLAACTLTITTNEVTNDGSTGGNTGSSGGNSGDEITVGEGFTVTRVIDGDTVEVRAPNNLTYRVRYVGINTPESDEPCFADARSANANLVDGRQVRLERDQTNTDRFGRLLRYIYVGDTFVNESLIRDGWAEVTLYPPDDAFFDRFRSLEQEATNAGRGCHPTGIFNDNTYNR